MLDLSLPGWVADVAPRDIILFRLPRTPEWSNAGRAWS